MIFFNYVLNFILEGKIINKNLENVKHKFIIGLVILVLKTLTFYKRFATFYDLLIKGARQ